MTNVTPQDGPQDGQPASDEDALIPGLPISGPLQIVGLGLLVFVALFFGGEILDLLQ